MTRGHGSRQTNLRRLTLGLLLPWVLALAAMPAAGAPAALQGGENSYTDPTYGWSISWDPAIWMNGGELPTAANDAGVAGNEVAIATIDYLTYGGVLVGSYSAYGDDLAACLADVPAAGQHLGFTLADMRAADLEPPATADDAESILAYATIDLGGTPFNGLIYGECRPLVEDEAVLRIVWVLLDVGTYETALPVFEDLLAGVDLSGARSASGRDASGETYTDPLLGWSVSYDPQAWTLDAPIEEYSDTADGGRDLTSSGAGLWGYAYDLAGNVYIRGEIGFGDDIAACLDHLRESETAGALDLEEVDLEPPTAPDDARWELYRLDTGGGPAIVYIACVPLVEGEAVLSISWSLGDADEYANALPIFNRLLAGLDLSGAHPVAAGEDDAGETAAKESFTDPIYGWSIAWDSELWEAEGPIPTVGENEAPGTQMNFLGRDYVGMGFVRIGSLATVSLDPAACVELFRPKTSAEITSDGAVVEDLREPDLPLPPAPPDAVGRLFQYAPGDQITYLACWPLVEGEALLLIEWYLPEAPRYEDALPAFEALIAGLDLGGGEVAGTETGDADDEASAPPTDEGATAGEAASFTDPIHGWTIVWDAETWTLRDPAQTAPNEAGEVGTLLTFDGADLGLVTIAGETVYDGEALTCLYSATPRFAASAVRDVDLDPPAVPEGAEWSLQVYVDESTQREQVLYVECRPLIEGVAVLAITWSLPDLATYEEALPAFEALLAGLDLDAD